MPRKRTSRRAVIDGVAPYRQPRPSRIYRSLRASIGLVFWALKAVVGIWALYWFFIILGYMLNR